MHTLYLLYFRENNGTGEYIVLVEEDLDKDAIEEYEKYGYHFESKLKLTTNDHIHNLPLDTELNKSLY